MKWLDRIRKSNDWAIQFFWVALSGAISTIGFILLLAAISFMFASC